MNFDEYRQHDAIGLAQRVRQGEVTALELLDCAVQRIAEVNPQLNAVIVDLTESALDAARRGLPEGPLHGVPFLLKDLSATVAGVPTGAGTRILADVAALADSAIVASHRAAGLNLIGKTNTPEFGLTCVTEPFARGATLNPWDPTLTCGGSSGGSAAAVAAGIVPAAHASDGGGSIRIPASCCGLFGLKPSRGRVSQSPAGEGWGGLSVQHAVTRSVRDSALLLDLTSGPRPGDPYWLNPPADTFLSAIERAPEPLRIAFISTALNGSAIDPECATAVADVARLCEGLGHHVEEMRPEADYEQMVAALGLVVAVATATTMELEARRRGSAIKEGEVEALSWAMYQGVREIPATQSALAMQTFNTFSRQIAPFFQQYDVLLLSTLGQTPVPLGTIDMNASDLSSYGEALGRFMPNTQTFNVTGQPAMSMPLAWSSTGVPIGIQFAARVGEESTLLRLAGQIEQERPWFNRHPPPRVP